MIKYSDTGLSDMLDCLDLAFWSDKYQDKSICKGKTFKELSENCGKYFNIASKDIELCLSGLWYLGQYLGGIKRDGEYFVLDLD